MAWWDKFLGTKSAVSLHGQEYRVAFSLHSLDGKRRADVIEFRNGEIYLREMEWVEADTFHNRHRGSPVGPFASTTAAEVFITATDWFRGNDA